MRRTALPMVLALALTGLGSLSSCSGGTCTPNCAGKCGGSDSCSGTCPDTCSAPQICQAPDYTQCAGCTPDCTGKCGGLDGCGGACPDTCTAPQVCQAPDYILCAGCTPDCTGKCGGLDGCGGDCSDTCTAPQVCQAPDYTQCTGCTPNCAGKCGGTNGCNGTCPDTCTAPQVCLSPAYTQCGPSGASLVVIVHNPAVWDGVGSGNNSINAAEASRMVQEGVKALTGEATAEEAWNALMPDLAGKKVAIKPNGAGPTHNKVLLAVIDGIEGAGTVPENIFVFEKSAAALNASGFPTLNEGGPGVQVYLSGDLGWSAPFYTDAPANRVTGRIPNVVADADYLINVPLMKEILGYGGGISLAMKNHFGTVDSFSHQGGECSPDLANISAQPDIKNKTALVLIESIFPVRGNDTTYTSCKMLFSRDILAIERVGWQLINEARLGAGLAALPEPKHFAVAAGLGIGVNDDALIQKLLIEL